MSEKSKRMNPIEAQEFVAKSARRNLALNCDRVSRPLPKRVRNYIEQDYEREIDAEEILQRFLWTDLGDYLGNTSVEATQHPFFNQFPTPKYIGTIKNIISRLPIRDKRFFAHKYTPPFSHISKTDFPEWDKRARECQPDWFTARRVAEAMLWDSLFERETFPSAKTAKKLLNDDILTPIQNCLGIVEGLPEVFRVFGVMPTNTPEVLKLRSHLKESLKLAETLKDRAEEPKLMREPNAATCSKRFVFAMAADALLHRIAPCMRAEARMEIVRGALADGRSLSPKTLSEYRRRVKRGELLRVGALFKVYALEFPRLPQS